MEKKKVRVSKQRLKEVIKKIVRKELLSEGIRPDGQVDSTMTEKKLPDEFIRQMINHADRYTSRRFRMQIWESNWKGDLKTADSLIKELKTFINKEKHDEFMEFAEVLMVRFGLKEAAKPAKDQHLEKIKEKKK